MQILLAEDSRVTAKALCRSLSSMGHEVFVASDGLQAWQMFRELPTSVVLSDWMMPGLDGPALCRHIRAAEDARYTYFILLTARQGRADRMEGLRCGADDFLPKPVDVEELEVRLEIARRILSVHNQLARQNDRLTELASTDELTGLANRREFRRALGANFAQAEHLGQPMSLILVDIDHFKALNDAFGHTAGDEALRMFAATLRASCRYHETVARHGGEEFAVLLTGAGRQAALDMSERLRTGVAEREWPHRPLTASFGVATSGPGVGTATDLMERADAALYASKRFGRDRVTHHDELGMATRSPG